MQSGSQPASSPDRPSKLAHLFGVLIALITLTLPAIVISSYSSNLSPAPPTRDQTAASQ